MILQLLIFNLHDGNILPIRFFEECIQFYFGEIHSFLNLFSHNFIDVHLDFIGIGEGHRISALFFCFFLQSGEQVGPKSLLEILIALDGLPDEIQALLEGSILLGEVDINNFFFACLDGTGLDILEGQGFSDIGMELINVLTNDRAEVGDFAVLSPHIQGCKLQLQFVLPVCQCSFFGGK